MHRNIVQQSIKTYPRKPVNNAFPTVNIYKDSLVINFDVKAIITITIMLSILGGIYMAKTMNKND